MSYHHISGIHVPVYNRKDDWYNYDSYSSKSNAFHVRNPVSPRESSEKIDQSASATSDWVTATKAMWFNPFSTVVRVQCHVEFGGLNMLASLEPYVTQQPTWISSAIPDYLLSESRAVLGAEQPIDSHTLETTPIKIDPSKCDKDDLVEIPGGSTEDSSITRACDDLSPRLAASFPVATEPLEPCKESTKACPAPPATLARHPSTTVDQSSAVLEQTIAIQGRSNLPPVVTPSGYLGGSLDPIIPATISPPSKSPKLSAQASSTNRQGLSSLSGPFPSHHSAHHSRLGRVKRFKLAIESSAKQPMVLRLPAECDGFPKSPLPTLFNSHPGVIQKLLWRLRGPLSLRSAYFWVSNRDSDAPISFPSGRSSGMGQESRGSGSPSNARGEIQSGQGPGPDLSSVIGEADIPGLDALPSQLHPLVEEWAAASSTYAQLETPTIQQYREPPPPPPLGLFIDILLRGYCIGRFDGWDDMLPPSEMDDQTRQPALPIESTTLCGGPPWDSALPVPPGPQLREGAPIPSVPAPANATSITLGQAGPASSSATHLPCPSPLHSLPQSATSRNRSAYQRQSPASNPDESFVANDQAPHAGSVPRAQSLNNGSAFPAAHSNRWVDATIIAPRLPPQVYGYQAALAPIDTVALFEPDSKVLPGQEVVGHRHHCPSCGSSYQKPYQLVDHIAAKHTGTPKQHLCKLEGCNRAYTTRSNMLKHFNKDHRGAGVPQITLEVTGQQPRTETTEHISAAGILAHTTIPGADTHYSGQFVPYNEEGVRKKYARHRRRK